MSLPDPVLIYLIAGEASGDNLGASLMESLRRLYGDQIRFAGIGGQGMIGQGLQPLFPMTDLSVMGLTEVVRHLPRLIRRLRQTTDDILHRKPDLVVTIDAPDFSFRVARKVAKAASGIKLVHYVAPSVWAWRPGRAKKIAAIYDHLLVLLPFEPPYFTQVGLPCTFVGHPATDTPPLGDALRFRRDYGLGANSPVILLLPGSRQSEIERLLPLFLDCARSIRSKLADTVFVIPTLPYLQELVETLVIATKFDGLVVSGEAAKRDAFAAARVALAASGTVALELCLAGVPAVISYRVSALSAFLARRLVRVKFVSLVNLVLNQPVMPELLQEDATVERIVPEMLQLVAETTERHAQILSYINAGNLLKPSSGSSGEAAARAVWSVLTPEAVGTVDHR